MRFKVTVTRTDEYEIEIDENIIDKKYLADWENTFYPCKSQEKHAEILAVDLMREGSNAGFIEGFGNLKKFQGKEEDPSKQKKDYGHHFQPLQDDQYSAGIKVFIISEDEDYETDIEQIL